MKQGDYVYHLKSGWAGSVTRLREQADGEILVTVRPDHPRPREMWIEGTGRRGRRPSGFVPTADWWRGWKPITVFANELEVLRDGAEG
jgi:hypothetical protein